MQPNSCAHPSSLLRQKDDLGNVKPRAITEALLCPACMVSPILFWADWALSLVWSILQSAHELNPRQQHLKQKNRRRLNWSLKLCWCNLVEYWKCKEAEEMNSTTASWALYNRSVHRLIGAAARTGWDRHCDRSQYSSGEQSIPDKCWSSWLDKWPEKWVSQYTGKLIHEKVYP